MSMPAHRMRYREWCWSRPGYRTNHLVRPSALRPRLERDYSIVVGTSRRSTRDRGQCARSQNVGMLGVISRARSVIDTITINVRAGGTRLPGQSQSSGVGVLRKQSGNDQQRGGKPAALEKPCKTMEVIVNAVVLSTDRACCCHPHAKKVV